MGRYALSRRRLAVAISSVALAVAGGAVLPSAAVAAPVVPWTAATAITGTDVSTDVLDVVTTPDGSAVTLWNQFARVGGGERKLYAAVRAEGSDTWGVPKLLATTPAEAGAAQLHASADGTVTALWVELPDNTAPGDGNYATRLVGSALSADHSAWSAPAEIVGTGAAWGGDGGIDLAEAPDGTLTAVWATRTAAGSAMEVYGSTRGGEGTWSAPVPLSTAATDGAHFAAEPSVAVTSDGTTVVVYKQQEGPSARLLEVTRAAGAAEWSAPVAATGSYQSVGDPEVTAGDDGSLTLAWPGTDASEDTTILTSTRSAAGTWSAPETVTASDSLAGTPEPLIAPDGDVTLVWVDYTTTFSARTATRDAATGTWSTPQTLSTSYAGESYDATIGRDGTVRALWNQSGALRESVRTDGTWTAPTELPGSTNAWGDGEISVGPDGSATAVWSAAKTDSGMARLWGSRTAWPTLAVTGSTVPTAASLKSTTSGSTVWAPAWQLSRPTSSWSLTIKDPAGKTIRTLTGTTADLKVAASWNGRTTSGGYAPNGPLTWTLDATQQGATTAVKLASGRVTVSGGAAVARDFGGPSGTPDGTGDLLTLNSSGALSFHYGGTFTGKATGTGWATSITAVPFGDLSGDRCNDVLVRQSNGSLRLYKPACGKAVTPSTAYSTVGTSGWGQYDVLTSTGDVSGDGRPDLVARNTATGDIYLYKGTGTGGLSARTKIFADWRTYTKIVGVGDITGDGIGDLIGQDKSNNLYRYDGTPTGTFKTRVKVLTNWGGSYNAIAGAGDVTGDGKADIVARDTSGNLYRHNGDGKGSLGAGTKIATGWGGYKTLS